ncbi:MAG: protein kinase, partial [Cyanobacteria bacterium J06641_5]
LRQRYELVREIGRGGFGRTFLGVDNCITPGRQCAIKKLQPLLTESQQESQQFRQVCERFHREATALAQLSRNCRQIPHFYDRFSEGGDFYLVQEWIEGTDLAQTVSQKGTFTPEAVIQLLRDLLPTLSSIHHNRVIHRDIKPGNIILRDRDRLPVLIDFGAVKEVMGLADNGNRPVTKTAIVGTPSYMAPEQAVGRPVYASDLYSLALTAVHLLTGDSPEELPDDPHTGEILWRKSLPNLRGPLATVLDKSLRFHPRDRFASAEDMLDALGASSRRSIWRLPLGSLTRLGYKHLLMVATAVIGIITTAGIGEAGFRFVALQWLSQSARSEMTRSSMGALTLPSLHDPVIPERFAAITPEPVGVPQSGPASIALSLVMSLPKFRDLITLEQPATSMPGLRDLMTFEQPIATIPDLVGAPESVSGTAEPVPAASVPKLQNLAALEKPTEIFPESTVAAQTSSVGAGLLRSAWYGPGYHGNRTASGETFSRWARTAAHPTGPFGTQVLTPDFVRVAAASVSEDIQPWGTAQWR